MTKKSNIFAGRVIFDHLPKTAGQAINSWLTKALGTGCITKNLIGSHQDLIRRYGGQYSIISGHVIFQSDGLDQRYHYITSLREPVDRALSWLFFVLKNHESEQLPGIWKQVERFVVSEGEDFDPRILGGYISNLYVEHFISALCLKQRSEKEKLVDALSVIEQYDVWGLFEEMTAFLEDVAALIKLPAPKQIERVNVTRSRPAVGQISPLFRKRLEALNEMDIEFYHVLRERWHKERNHRPTILLPESSPWVPFNPVQTQQEFSTPGFTLLSMLIEDGNTRTFSRGQSISFDLEFSLAMDVDELEIGIHILDQDNRKAFDSNTTMLKQPLLQVEHGTHRLRFQLVANLSEGLYTAGFIFVERHAEGNRELARYNELVTFRISVLQSATSLGYANLPVEFSIQKMSNAVLGKIQNAAGTLTSDTVLGNIAVEEVFDLHVLLENASAQTWVSTQFNPINLSYHWLDQTGNIVVFNGKRSSLPAREILPGQTLTTQMKVMAPDVPDLYRLMLLPVQEKHCWFDKCGFTPGMLELEVVASGAARYFPAADLRLLSQVGKREESSIISTGREGFLLFGPYLRLPAGQYAARLEGSCELGTPGIWLDVVCDQAKPVLVRQEIIENAKPGLIAEQFFELAETVNDLEVRLWVTANALVRIEALRIEPSISDIKATELPEIIEVSEISPASSTLQ